MDGSFSTVDCYGAVTASTAQKHPAVAAFRLSGSLAKVGGERERELWWA